MDLDLRRVIKGMPKDNEQTELRQLTTIWGEQVGEEPLFRSHPRPLLARQAWQTLDGWWDCSFQEGADSVQSLSDARPPRTFDHLIRVPFSPEAMLSGVGRQLQPDELLWYRRQFDTPALPGGSRCILHFDGVDYACVVYVNGAMLAEHRGAYLPFELDVTDVLAEGSNELLVCVRDPSETGTQLRGKQRLARAGSWFTAQSGIWQSVWLEVVPKVHVRSLACVTDLDAGELSVTAAVEGIAILTVEVIDEGQVTEFAVQSRRIEGRMSLRIRIPNVCPWTPDDPKLYDLRITYGDDQLMSYCAFRSVTVEDTADDKRRICLNHRPFFLRGLLDQGYWPDGLMTAPGEEAMAFDLHAVRSAGFDAIRMHVKVEPSRFYALCDRMGVLVLQDMPSGGAIPSSHWSRDLPALHRAAWHGQRDNTPKAYTRLGSADEVYRQEWRETCQDVVSRLAGHPSVIAWALFNESWGQFDAQAATDMVRDIDPTRPILACSGWYDQGVGDIRGIHNYYRGMRLFADHYAGKGEGPDRAQLISGFGGLAWSVRGHCSVPFEHDDAQYESEEEWQEALSSLLAQADALRLDGLSGFIYTQLADVEEQTDGLLTYDRKVSKII